MIELAHSISKFLLRVVAGVVLFPNLLFAAVSVIDDEGTVIEIDFPATRIVSLAPSLTEIVFAAGAGDKLVGVVEYSDFPAAAKTLPIVGRFDLLDMERILQLNPDLIVAWQTGNPRNSVARLRELGFTVYMAEPKQLESIPSHVERLATLAGTESTGHTAAMAFRATLRELTERYQHTAPVSVFYQVWNSPLITAGGNELINDIISLCGGRNIFADIMLVAPKVSLEAVLARNPAVIIASGMDIERPEWLDEWKRWPSIEAAQQDNLFFVPPDLLQRHTPRALDGARQTCEHIANARAALISQ